MDTIFSRQNQQGNIHLLCTQRQLYIEAKRVFKFQILLTCIATVLLGILKLVLSIWGVDIAAIILFINSIIGAVDILLMATTLSDYKKKAAKAQEEFDSSVFDLPWNKTFIGSSKNPTEVTNKYCRKFIKSGGDVNKLYDWYSTELSNFSGNELILRCQRSSLVYDIDIRNRFRWLAVKFSFGAILVLSIIAFIVDSSLTKSIIYIASFWPIVMLVLKIRSDQKKAIATSEETKQIIDGFLTDPINIEDKDVKDIQKRIYTNRKDGPVIPEEYYNKIRDILEAEMHDDARMA